MNLKPAELEGLFVLRGVDVESVRAALERCTVRALSAGEQLLRAGQPNQHMYMILSGRLGVHLDSSHAEAVASLEAGETVGEMSVIDGSLVSADVVAAEPSRLLAVDRDTFWNLVMVSHGFAVNLLFKLAERLRASNSTVSENSRLKKQFERDALFDGLTGIRNRRWLDQTLPRLIERHRRDKRPLAILVVDVDHFKRFNDSFGHHAGDRVLSAVARVLTDTIRPTDFVARFGGEEFVVVLTDADGANARRVAERLRTAVSQATFHTADGTALPSVTISLGLAEIAPHEDMQALFARADAALYRAKERGRNRVET